MLDTFQPNQPLAIQKLYAFSSLYIFPKWHHDINPNETQPIGILLSQLIPLCLVAYC